MRRIYSNNSQSERYLSNNQKDNSKKKILIVELNNQCNNSCFFCSVDKSGNCLKEFLLNQIEYAGHSGFKNIDFTGSEPTLNTNLFEYIKKAAESGFKNITIFTNGRMFCYADYCSQLIDSGVNKIIFSLHADTAALHDKISNAKGSFAQLVKGIRQIGNNRNLILGGYLTIHKRNLGRIDKTIEFFDRQGLKFFILSPVLPGPFELKNSVDLDRDIILSINDIDKIKRRLIKINKPNISLNFIPHCLLVCKGNWEIKNQKGLSNCTIISENGRKIEKLKNIIDGITHQKEQCFKCSKKSVCEGELNNIDVENRYLAFWCISDLHVSESYKEHAAMIFKDVNNLIWSKAFFIGDIIDGDKGKGAYIVYKNLLSSYLKDKNIYHLAGNHEYVYKKDLFILPEYKNIIFQTSLFSMEIGNICFILLPINLKQSDLQCPQINEINNDTFIKLYNLLEKKINKIRIVMSHFPVNQTKVERMQGKDLSRLIPKEIMPEIWISGHSSEGFEVIKKQFDDTFFFDCNIPIKSLQSRFFLFENGSPFIIIKVRNHFFKKFVGKDIHINIGKEFKMVKS